MIINNLHIIWSVFLPDKADSILIIDTNAVLTKTIPLQRFQTIAWWNTKIINGFGGI